VFLIYGHMKKTQKFIYGCVVFCKNITAPMKTARYTVSYVAVSSLYFQDLQMAFRPVHAPSISKFFCTYI